jgi:hypothetical protein
VAGDWIDLAEEKVQWRAFVNTSSNLQILKKSMGFCC